MKKTVEITAFHLDEELDIELFVDPALSPLAQSTYLEIIKQTISKTQKNIQEKAQKSLDSLFPQTSKALVAEPGQASS